MQCQIIFDWDESICLVTVLLASCKPQGIDILDLQWVIQYCVPHNLSTWWQCAGHGGQRLSVDAIAIFLAEPRYFNDEREKAAARAGACAETLKQSANDQLQPDSSKRAHTGATTAFRVSSSTIKVASWPTEKPKIEQVMDDFVNAER